MDEREWSAVPVGVDAHRWVTRAGCRTVLVAVHSVVSGQRLLDVVEQVESDPRVQVVFTRAPDVFGTGVARFLDSAGALEIPWRQAVHERFDLVLAAACGAVDRLHGPLVLMAHGAGYGKRIGPGGQVYGLDAQRLTRDGRVLPAALLLSHEEQRAVLAEQCPEALPVAAVVGDCCYDRMVLSAPSRDRYRRAMGVRAGQELVVVASTWGRSALVERHRELFAAVVRELDPTRFRVAALIHPAVWSGHGHRQLRSWLAGPRAGGLHLVEPERDWRPTAIAADHVIGDHGSTAVYAAALGASVLVTGSGADQLQPGSAQAFLASRAPRWRPGSNTERQLRAAARTRPDDLVAGVVARLTERPGQAHALVRERLYELLGLPVPGRHRLPDPIRVPGAPIRWGNRA